MRRADGTYDGFRWLGNCPEFDLEIQTENYQHKNSEGGLNEIDLDIPISVTRTSNVKIDNLDNDNLSIFAGATTATYTQAATAVTNFALNKIRTNRAYQLGEDLTPSGARGVSAVAVDLNAAVRANSTAYAKGAIYTATTDNTHAYICTVAGTSGIAEPTYTTGGTTFTDGTATFLDLGVYTGLTSGTDFLVDGALGLVSIGLTGKLATMYTRAIAVMTDAEFSINVLVDYTPAANTRTQIATGSTAAVRGKLKFVADNPYGENQDVLIPDCTISPSGKLPFIGANEAASVDFKVGINILNSTTAAIYIDNRPA